jgi:hypothetical protein
MHPQRFLGFLKRSTLAKFKTLKTEAVLISISSLHAKPKVQSHTEIKLDTEIFTSFLGLLAGTSESHHWSQMDP